MIKNNNLINKIVLETRVIPSSPISSCSDFELSGLPLQFRLALSALALNLATYSSKSIKFHHSFSIHIKI